MKISEEYLLGLGACRPAIKLWLDKPETDPLICIVKLEKIDKHDYAAWLLAKLMTPTNAAKFAIYSAENVLSVFEAEYPNDNQPRKAIQAAKRVLKNPTKENIYVAGRAGNNTWKTLLKSNGLAFIACSSSEYAVFAAKQAALFAKNSGYYDDHDDHYGHGADAADRAAIAANCAIHAKPTEGKKIVRYGKILIRKQLKGGAN
jgi:hypothetical protein